MLDSETNRQKVISDFPRLRDDDTFKIVDGENPNYNCIAYAGFHDDVWWQPLPEGKRPIISFDGVTYDWPFGAANNTLLATYVGIFQKLGYEVCDNEELEEGFRKIALYGSSVLNVSHAARQIVTGKDAGKWKSKLGQSFLIKHKNASMIEGEAYGTILQFMKHKFP